MKNGNVFGKYVYSNGAQLSFLIKCKDKHITQ
jgi:hypothetical protein